MNERDEREEWEESVKRTAQGREQGAGSGASPSWACSVACYFVSELALPGLALLPLLSGLLPAPMTTAYCCPILTKNSNTTSLNSSGASIFTWCATSGITTFSAPGT